MSEKNFKKFIAVEWEDGKHSVVPTIWYNGHTCAWPDENIELKSQKYEAPQKNWRRFNIIKVLTTSSK